ncbi:hypothetical protein KIN20_022556 [Parelaphostrongylus tenuis]|uniref:Uncharacterized protein n=1 Tax=Parelaphostrongylus tenuis TaxID=148309 RepID=A0AAD5N5P6_PARTN|nr:hypothetical protein KIN20_022556 [Parelaphostrongylus tenuis]
MIHPETNPVAQYNPHNASVLATIPGKRSCKPNTKMQATMLRSGLLIVLNPTTKRLEKIHILLDTRAELCFIEEKMVGKLHLLNLDEIMLHLNAFGSDDVQEHLARKVSLDVWDA